jgi:hypothetical protein
MPKRSRAIIYVRGTSEEIDEQLDSLTAVSTRRGYELAGIVRDDPGSANGYHDAHRMLRHGEADLIIVSSVTVLPGVIESATGSLSAGRVREILRDLPDAQRRTRPIRRRGGGGA